MDFDLSPKFPEQVIFEGEGGSYKAWSGSGLANANVGGGKLALKPRGFALPHFADCSKIGFVLQGTGGLVGMVLPNTSKEIVVNLKKGDVIPVPLGAISWWYNNGGSEIDIVFLGETSKAIVPGQFTYFFLAGATSVLSGFSKDFISQAFNVSQENAHKLAKSQNGVLMVKLEDTIDMPHPDKCTLANEMVYDIESASSADVEVKNGGVLKSLTVKKLPFLEQVGLSVNHLKLNTNAMCSPTYTADGSTRLFYVVKGGGRAQIVGLNGKPSLNADVETGQSFLVPKFFTIAVVAGSDGLELISITNSTRPVVEELTSAWSAISPTISQVSLNVSPKLQQLLNSNINKGPVIVPSKN